MKMFGSGIFAVSALLVFITPRASRASTTLYGVTAGLVLACVGNVMKTMSSRYNADRLLVDILFDAHPSVNPDGWPNQVVANASDPDGLMLLPVRDDSTLVKASLP